jgi:hypothetical protein
MHKACTLVGGVSKLAHYLHEPTTSVMRWLDGDERPPTRVFLDCADVILFHERHLADSTALDE